VRTRCRHVHTLLVCALRPRHHWRHVARQNHYPLLALDLTKRLLVRGIDILFGLLLGGQKVKRWAFERILGRDGVVGWAKLSRSKGIALGSNFGEVALQIPPHEPQEGRRAAPAAEIGAHDEVEEVAGREEMQLGDLGRVLRKDEDEVDGIRAWYGSLHNLVDGAGLLLVLGGALEDRLQARGVLQLLVGVGVLVGLQRGDRVVGPQLGAHLGEDCMTTSARRPGASRRGLLTVERRVHAAHVDQQTHHGHVDGGRALRQQLVLEDLAALAALGHGIEVDVGKRVHGPGLRVRLLGEDGLVVLEHELEEIVLDVLAPQRDAIVLFQVLDLVAAVDRRHAAVRIAARRRRRRSVVGARPVAVAGSLGAVGRICVLAVVGRRRVGGRRRRARVVHGGFGSQNVSQAVSRIRLLGACARDGGGGGSSSSSVVHGSLRRAMRWLLRAVSQWYHLECFGSGCGGCERWRRRRCRCRRRCRR